MWKIIKKLLYIQFYYFPNRSTFRLLINRAKSGDQYYVTNEYEYEIIAYFDDTTQQIYLNRIDRKSTWEG